ncbi:translocation/assembly module TamB domain-containing protein [Sphingomonas sp. CJ99]
MLLAMLVVAAIVGIALWIDTPGGHRLIAQRIAAIRPANGLTYSVQRIEGSIYGRARLYGVAIRDPKGLVYYAPRADLDWRPLAGLANRLDIRSLVVPESVLLKLPEPVPTGRTGPILPGFDIAIARLQADRVLIGRRIGGRVRQGMLAGRADIRDGRALVDVTALVAGSDRLRLRLDVEPDRDRFDLDGAAMASANGVIARLSGLRRPVLAEIRGDGSWRRWRGTARLRSGNVPLIDLALANQAGDYRLNGTLSPAPLIGSRLRALVSPRLTLVAAGTVANRRIEGRMTVRSDALAVDSQGGIDLRTSAFRNLRTEVRLARPAALLPGMAGTPVTLRLVLDGAFDSARFDYRLAAERVAFGNTGFDRVLAAGQGRLSRAPVTVPIRLSAARVTGVGEVAGGILTNLSVQGALQVTARTLTASDLIVRSDKLNARAGLVVDFPSGRYEVMLNGGLTRLLIPGLGIVDVQSRLTVVPDRAGRGVRIVGRGVAQVRRLDNAFLLTLAKGLPRIETELERGNDGVIYFRNARLTSPGLTLAGNGYRRNDGSFHVEATGRHVDYGPVQLVLDGPIQRPAIRLRLAAPGLGLGLKGVDATLDPTADGFDFAATGQSLAGRFISDGAILLPPGGTTRIRFDRIDVSGGRATGTLDVVPGGFQGTLSLAGGGLSGEARFAPQNGVQRIDGSLEAREAVLADRYAIRRGRASFAVVLTPGAPSVEAEVRAFGISNGSLRIARAQGTARLVNGEGEVRATIAGARGRGFEIETVTQVSDGVYRIAMTGTVDRRPIQFDSPAELRFTDTGWRLSRTRLTFAGGSTAIAATRDNGVTQADIQASALPLSLLDIAYPGLGLGGTVSGTLALTDRGDGRPTGRIDARVRGLTRAGLVLSSRAVDMGLTGVIDSGRAAARAVIASGGQTIGRAQMRLAPLSGQGDLMTQLAAAPLFAQLRYSGPADTLWRLTGLELFDLTGPVAIGADIGGTLNDPNIRGSLRTNGARIESGLTGTVLSDIQSTGRFTGSQLVLDQFQARARNGGNVTGTGSFTFSARAFAFDLNAQAENAELINLDNLGATVTGPIRIRSDGSGGTISGEVRLNRARYQLGNAAALATPLPRLNVREINLPFGREDETVPNEPWRLDLRARTNNLAVTGLGLDSIWRADLVIRGEPTNPAISGEATLDRGDYEFAGRDFELQRGIIRFDGRAPANPSLDIVAAADADNLNASILVRGNALQPEISFASTPALPQDELLSRLLFGTSITNLSAPEALQLAAAVAALQGDGDGGLNPINAVRSAIGLDRLRILPADPQTGAETSIAAGKFLTRRAYVEIITDGQGYSATRAEFRVTRWLSLLGSISTIGRQSINVRVQRDY